jgi:hypothetical protein
MQKIATSISGIIFLAVSGMPVYGANETKIDVKDARTIFESKCSVCHKFEKATSKNKTSAEWEKTIKRMIESRGARTTNEEAKIIKDYLAENYGKRP